MKVYFAFDRERSLIYVHIVDSGIGIDPADAHSIYNKFGKLLRTANQNDEGIGLGLMVSKALVEANSGTIDFFSEGVGHGCAFFFSMHMTEVSEKAEQQLLTMTSTKPTKARESNEVEQVPFRRKTDQAKF